MTSTRYFSVNGTKMRITGMSDTVNRSPAFEEACDIPTATYAVGGPYVVNGTVDMLYRKTACGILFDSLLGATNVFTDTPKSKTISIGDEQGGYATTYTGCGFSSFEMTLSVRDFVKTRWSWIGSGATARQTGATGDLTVSEEAAVYYNAVINVDSSPITCKGLTMRIDRKFDTDYYYLGSPFLQGLYQNGQAEFGGSITLGAGQYEELAKVISGGTSNSITACKNELYTGELEIILKDKDCTTISTFTCGNIVFADMNRSVTGRNMWDKTLNYRVVLPTNSDFTIA